jgi:hypothetical protein
MYIDVYTTLVGILTDRIFALLYVSTQTFSYLSDARPRPADSEHEKNGRRPLFLIKQIRASSSQAQ